MLRDKRPFCGRTQSKVHNFDKQCKNVRKKDRPENLLGLIRDRRYNPFTVWLRKGRVFNGACALDSDQDYSNLSRAY
jgi:hypothetical protein